MFRPENDPRIIIAHLMTTTSHSYSQTFGDYIKAKFVNYCALGLSIPTLSALRLLRPLRRAHGKPFDMLRVNKLTAGELNHGGQPPQAGHAEKQVADFESPTAGGLPHGRLRRPPVSPLADADGVLGAGGVASTFTVCDNKPGRGGRNRKDGAKPAGV